MGFSAPDADDDAALARRIIDCAPERDAAAEAEICRRLGPRIRLYGLKHLRNEAAAADLMQDVLVMVLQKLREGTVREPERLASFVLGTARQMVVDGRRSGRRRGRILEAFPLDLMPPDEEAPEPLDTERLGSCLGGTAGARTRRPRHDVLRRSVRGRCRVGARPLGRQRQGHPSPRPRAAARLHGDAGGTT